MMEDWRSHRFPAHVWRCVESRQESCAGYTQLVYNDEQFVAPREDALVVVSAGILGGVMDRNFWFVETTGRPNLILCPTGMETKILIEAR
jgi:hypothetical protein